VGTFLLILVFIPGCIYLFEEEPDVPSRNEYWIDSEADEFVFHQKEEEINWNEWNIMISEGNDTYLLESEGKKITKAGDKTVFKDPNGVWDPILGVEYTMRIIDTIDNKILLEDDFIAE
jgi:hypothetical protein